ncbi:MAG: hypothetical protein ABS79_00550 [Planctomycetes bacterium SCN 63-9]|nr:MAG: hypothetical protein ABS79_00550 [Planctomycetes bacterium SCN 63-9]
MTGRQIRRLASRALPEIHGEYCEHVPNAVESLVMAGTRLSEIADEIFNCLWLDQTANYDPLEVPELTGNGIGDYVTRDLYVLVNGL